jgi:hypothetical protein
MVNPKPSKIKKSAAPKPRSTKIATREERRQHAPRPTGVT